ncbi:pentatricopeptide repeat-containing protein [Iris pallida]|uniref:Pentatricopeptide repeat-containing protein n=1 Tax=Iris pallida TaxID=29817 RepID=A0AAX6EFA0_IRIPA|nr:pentatricopeptide repeat-containing protein [Iris pallida]
MIIPTPLFIAQQNLITTLQRSLSPPSALSFLSPFSTSPPKPTFSHTFQQCSKRPDPNAGRAAHARMLASGFVPTAFVTNCLIHMYITHSDLDSARRVFDRMPQRDTVSYNAMISGHANNGRIDIARSLFLQMPVRDAISWNSIISGHLHNGDPDESLYLFSKMASSGSSPDRATFAIVLKSCSLLEEYEAGVQVHGMVVKTGIVSDVVTGSALVDMYAKCRKLGDSVSFFRDMPERNWVSWGALIGGCVQNERFVDGLELFLEMQREGVGVSQSLYASVFRACAGLSCLRLGSQFHGHALKNNYSRDVVVGTAILDMYAKGNNLDGAMRVFQWLPKRTLQTWNAIVVGFVRNGQGEGAMELFQAMNRSDVGVDEISLSGVLSACAEANGYLQGLQLHCLAIKTGIILNICVNNAVLDMYGKCGALAEACNVFEEMRQRDAVSWNAIITALEQNEQYEETLMHFNQMLRCGMKADDFTYGSVLKACAGLCSLDFGIKVHSKIIKSELGLDSFIGSALVDMYCKCGMMEDAQKLHDRIQKRTLVSWNAIISGFSFLKQSEEAQSFFSRMLGMGLKPDNFTYATVLDTCANLAMAGLGKQIHAQIIKLKLQKDVFISSTLVDMYAKCGNMQDSFLMFEKMVEKDFVSWNVLICGYAQHGLGMEALKVFERMQFEKVRPNHATFVGVLRACAHVGLVDEGIFYFNSMVHNYQLEPQLEHYSCMVDIVGRSKGVYEALNLINGMPYEADAVTWRTLLSVCKIHRNVDVAEVAAARILQLDPEDSSAYILLSNIYADAGRWGEVSQLRRIMRQSGLKKEPGCSWIEVMSEMHAFLVGDKAHPKFTEIYNRLDELYGEMKLAGYVPDVEFFRDDEEEENQEQQEEFVAGNR